MLSAWFRSTFLMLLKFLQIKEGDLVSWVAPILQNGSFFSSAKVLRTQIFLIYYVSLHSARLGRTFVRLLKFTQIKVGWPNFWVEPILQKVWIIWNCLLYFNFKIFKEPNSSVSLDFNAFCMIQEKFSQFCLKLRSGDHMSVTNPFANACSG